MADIEKMKINLAKNEEKLAKKVALLTKYENKKAKLSAQWKKLTNEDYEVSIKSMDSKTDELSLWGKFEKYYSREVAHLYFDISTFYDYGKWTSNPIVQTQNGIKELEERCKKYRDSIAEEEKKVADRKASIESNSVSVNGKDVNVIVEFLNNWEKEVTDYWMKRFEYFEKEHESYYNSVVKTSIEYMINYNSWEHKEQITEMWKDSPYVEFYPTYEEYKNNHKYCDDCYHAINDALNEMKEEYESLFSIRQIEKWGKSKWSPKKEVFEENMRKDIAKEKDRKYDQLIKDVESIVGKIIDMSHIKIGVKGDLEGYVIGTNGEAELWTKGCGGFNTDVIVNVKHGQIFHFRFYVKRRA
jgi:predicted  nucleic acid-binding Zn-ribbon protein